MGRIAARRPCPVATDCHERSGLTVAESAEIAPADLGTLLAIALPHATRHVDRP